MRFVYILCNVGLATSFYLLIKFVPRFADLYAHHQTLSTSQATCLLLSFLDFGYVLAILECIFNCSMDLGILVLKGHYCGFFK
jgi:type II secretory pathway component PulF